MALTSGRGSTRATLRIAIERGVNNLKRFADLGRVYMPNGEVPKEGEPIRQPQLAATIKAIAQQGSEVFYRGWISIAARAVFRVAEMVR